MLAASLHEKRDTEAQIGAEAKLPATQGTWTSDVVQDWLTNLETTIYGRNSM